VNEKEYIEQRVDDQINWYSCKSSLYKKCFYATRTTELIVASILAIVSCTTYSQLTFCLSLLIVFLSGVIALYRFQELWISYRTTSESLKHEKYMYSTQTSPYHKEGSFNLFVENIEQIISSENSLWKQKALSREGRN